MMSSTSFRFSSLFFFFIVASMTVYSEPLTCRYKLIVQTGDDPEAGTNSRISVTLGNSVGQEVEIPDLKEWGSSVLPGHIYFQSGNRDLFEGTSVCFDDSTAPVCKITVTSDGSGEKPEWFLEEVEVNTYFGLISISKINFNFSKWLAKDELTASVDNCESSTSYSASF